mmetsp:Transcript_27138/g.77936  ORF Transcript_27138/g.77936 Transcript_27138/m.77936 type:complete len:214 (+) Transcript_27138:1643-2284(+)
MLRVGPVCLRSYLRLWAPVDVMVPAGQRDPYHAIVANTEAGPVGLGDIHQAWKPGPEGHDVDAFAIVAIEGASGDGLDRFRVGHKVGLCHGALTGLLLAEHPDLNRNLSTFGQVCVVHEIMAEDNSVTLLAWNNDVFSCFTRRVQCQGAPTAIDKVHDADLPSLIESEVALDHPSSNGIAPRIVEEVQFLIRVGAIHMQHAIASANTIESQVW